MYRLFAAPRTDKLELSAQSLRLSLNIEPASHGKWSHQSCSWLLAEEVLEVGVGHGLGCWPFILFRFRFRFRFLFGGLPEALVASWPSLPLGLLPLLGRGCLRLREEYASLGTERRHVRHLERLCTPFLHQRLHVNIRYWLAIKEVTITSVEKTTNAKPFALFEFGCVGTLMVLIGPHYTWNQ